LVGAVRRGQVPPPRLAVRSGRAGCGGAQALRLVAVARRVAYPSFGLASLLDAEPPALPDGLAGTYGLPADPASLRAAALATAALLRNAAAGAGEVLGADLDTVWAAKADARLAAVPG